MKIFSVTAFTFRMHSASLTMGISASRTRSGIGPASPMYPYPVTVHRFPAAWLTPRAGRQTCGKESRVWLRLYKLNSSFLPNKRHLEAQLDREVSTGQYRCPTFGCCGCDECKSSPPAAFALRGFRIYVSSRSHQLAHRLRHQIAQCCRNERKVNPVSDSHFN